MEHVLNDLFLENESPMIQRATITRAGRLEPQYRYLTDWVAPESMGL